MRTSGFDHSCLRYFIGNVRDRDRLYRAFDGIDVVIHAAALKQVPTAEYNPFEAIKTNILGAKNVVDAAIDRDVNQVLALSSDKACNPINLYGATKLCAEKFFTAANHYTGRDHPTKFATARYGNVVGSRGSVIPFFLEKRKQGILSITDERMTRFWITLEQAVDLVLFALETMEGGEIFVPKIPSMRIINLAQAIGPNCALEFTGIRPGEKLHEVLITEDEACHTKEMGSYYVIHPMYPTWADKELKGRDCPDRFIYRSDNNTDWLTKEELKELIDDTIRQTDN
jgi:UDP-N-acetylglucosamine 4,6-dehydratase